MGSESTYSTTPDPTQSLEVNGKEPCASGTLMFARRIPGGAMAVAVLWRRGETVFYKEEIKCLELGSEHRLGVCLCGC